LLRALPVKVEPVELTAAIGEVLELARSLDLTSYDASYVALAARRGMALATADARLRAACEQAGIDVLA
jgi:predicted nucleic acid-binding protein